MASGREGHHRRRRPSPPSRSRALTTTSFTRRFSVYKEKVRGQGASDRHRLYEVEGAWHISHDDDAISSFQFAGSRMDLSEETLDAMATGASYLPAVRDSLLLLDAWVSTGELPPPDRSVSEGTSLLP